MRIRHVLVAMLLFGAPFAAPHPARGAESYGNCNGYIDALPAAISMGGTWCLRKDLATGIANGNAIAIAADNVTIDCNGFKIGGLAAGDASLAIGIQADGRRHSTIRHCNIRGFKVGIELAGIASSNAGGGHLVEDNRLDNNLSIGIRVAGTHNLVRRNAVYDTGGYLYGIDSYGIYAMADITDNIIDGLFTTGNTNRLAGIISLGVGTQVTGNRIGGLAPNGGPAFGILTSDYSAQSTGSNQTIAGNRISTAASTTDTTGAGINGSGTSFCSGNTIGRFQTKQLGGCIDDGGNATF